MSKPSGYILWRGLSPTNQAPIVSILTLKSTNRKTGPMAQVWILCEESDPVNAIASGDDRAICGDCRHRKDAKGHRTCYVNPGQAPLSIYQAWKRGKYPHIRSIPIDKAERLFSTLHVRWGAYGDPALLPSSLVHWINSKAKSYTGYTHQWAKPWAQWTAGVFMASVDTKSEHDLAKAIGYKTFSVLHHTNTNCNHAKQCPATVEHSQTQCITCNLCNGNRTDVWVAAHGPSAKHVTYA